MHVERRAILVLAAIAALTGCSQADPASALATPCPEPSASTAQAALPSPTVSENDRVCKSMYGLPCNALTHMLGPMNAELRKETRACVNETVSVYVSGKWTPDNKYQNPKTGERYGDHCIAISL